MSNFYIMEKTVRRGGGEESISLTATFEAAVLYSGTSPIDHLDIETTSQLTTVCSVPYDAFRVR